MTPRSGYYHTQMMEIRKNRSFSCTKTLNPNGRDTVLSSPPPPSHRVSTALIELPVSIAKPLLLLEI